MMADHFLFKGIDSTMPIHKTIKTVLALTLCAATLSACNTIAGAGQDIKNAGSSIENSARGH